MALPQGGVRYFRKYLFDIPATEESFALGIVRDVERWQQPAGSAYDIFDFMVDGPGRLYKRGGTVYQSSDLTPTSPVAGGVLTVAVVAAEFPGDPRLLAIASNGAHGRTMFDVSGSSAVRVAEHAAGPDELDVQPYENPSSFTDETGTYVVIVDSQNAAVVPRKVYLNSGVVEWRAMQGNPPYATVSTSHPPYFVLANGNDGEGNIRPNRIWFSQRGRLDDASNNWQVNGINASWLDIDEPIMAMTSFGGSLLVWTRHRLLRITGDYAPGDENFNMGLQPVSSTGCIDARSVVKGTAGVYFANENGIYVTDGASVSSITEGSNGGISSMWREEYMTGYNPELGHVIAMGLYQDMFLFVSVIKTDSVSKSMLCYLPNLSWVKTTAPANADMYATTLAGPDGTVSGDIYLSSPFGTSDTTCRVVKASGFLQANVSNMYDADGTPILPSVETRAFTQGTLGLKRHGFGHVSYQMNSAANPTLRLYQATGIEATGAYIETKEGSPFPKTTAGVKRRRFRIYKDAQAMSYKLVQTAVSEQTEIYGIETEAGIFMEAEGQ